MVADKAEDNVAANAAKTDESKQAEPTKEAVAEKTEAPVEASKEIPAIETKSEESSEKNDFKEPETPSGNKSSDDKQIKIEPVETEQAKSETDALILSAEEEAEIAAQTNEEEPKSEIQKKKGNQKNVWVSNISRITKAADLKKIFSANFKVESAKIVTNGKNFFGYICLESPEMAQKSVADLNGSILNQKAISVSLLRPDLRGGRGSAADTKRRDARKIINEKKKENGVAKDGEKKEGDKDKDGTTEEKKAEDPEEEKMRQRRREQRNNRMIQDLKMDIKRLNTELLNNRRRLNDATRRLDGERDRKTAMRRELDTLESQLKSERRRFQQELEQMEKRRKMDEIRYQEDRSALNKELDECRKLREYLQRKVDEVGISRHSGGGRSPPRRSMGGRDQRMSDRGSDKMSRSRMHPSDSRGGRSPPPPPKLEMSRGRDRSPPSYKGGKKPRMDEPSMSFGNNHYAGQSSFQAPNQYSTSSGGPSGGNSLYGNTSYSTSQRYGSSVWLGNSNPMTNRPLGYPDMRGGARKY